MIGSQQKVLEVVQKTGHILLATHFNPDGDALGSLFGLAYALESMGKQVLRYLEETVSPMYRFLPSCGRVQTDMDAVRKFVADAGGDCITLCLDCGEPKRLGRHHEELMSLQPVVVIDHHKGEGFGDTFWIDSKRSSTGEMVFDLIRLLEAEISPKAAECLYAAISTDTGSFRYESTSSHTFNVASELVGLGVRPEQVSSNLYDNYTLGRLRLMQEVLETLEMYSRDRIAIIRVTQQMLEHTFTTMEDTEHFVNLPRAVRSVRVAVLLKESEHDVVTVSLRAKGHCDVALIAAQFGGGGHRNAAGFRARGQSLDAVRDALLPLLRQATQQN